MSSSSSAEVAQSEHRLVARLRFRHLEMLMALGDTGSLRAAARQIHLTQPAMSKAVSEIESAFGRPLFTRTARGLTPTPSGQLVIQGAKSLLRELTHLHQEMGTEESARIILRVGATPFMVQSHLPPVLKRLTAGATGIRVQVMEGQVPSLTKALLDGELDAAISTYSAWQDHLEGFRYETLWEVELVVIAAHTNPLTEARQISWETLSKEPWILPPASSMLRHEVDNCFRKASAIPPIPVVESPSPISNVHLVGAGIGIAVAPAAIVRQALTAGLVRRLKVTPALPRQPVALIYRDGLENPRVHQLRAALGRSGSKPVVIR